jgi:hypothetical protein
MARTQRKQSTQPRRNSPHTSTNDAERLAALRWLAMKIEQVSIELFVTDRHNFGAIEDALRLQVKSLRKMGGTNLALEDGDCPAGFVLCRDGLCSPMCNEELPPMAPPTPSPRRPRRSRA